MKIHAFSRFPSTPRRRYTALYRRKYVLAFVLCRVDSISVGKIKRSYFSSSPPSFRRSHVSRCIWHPERFASKRASERMSELRISAIDSARSTGVVNARHALTPSGCICIQRRKRAALLAAVHRYVPLGSFSLKVDEGHRETAKPFHSRDEKVEKEREILRCGRGRKVARQKLSVISFDPSERALHAKFLRQV